MQAYMKISRPSFLALLAALCILSNSGCGGNSENVVSVSGTVTHKGNPVPGLVISFVPVDKTETGVSTGQTDDSGHYSLTVVKTGASGAVVGKHKVWVSRPREPFVEPNEKDDKKKAKAPAKPAFDHTEILEKYGNLDKSPLNIEVKGGAPIDLKLD